VDPVLQCGKLCCCRLCQPKYNDCSCGRMASSFVSHSRRVAFSFGISENNCDYILFNLRIISCHCIRNSLMREGKRRKKKRAEKVR